MKKYETNIVRRGKFYFVIIREYRQILWFKYRYDVWRELHPRFLSKLAAGDLALHVREYLRGKYTPICTNMR